MTRIAIQGDRASFHDIVATTYFGESNRVFADSFEATFNALRDDAADYALVAIENSLHGSINEVYDLLLKFQFHIVGEAYLRVEQNLITIPGTKLEDIKVVYSHPVALAQCEAFLDEFLPLAERREYHDTAASVELVKEQGDKSIAAIAGAAAAELYSLEILRPSIETNKANYTRFVVLSKNAETSGRENKTSLVITTSHKPGALYHALGVFANRSINLSKLQSRPIIGKAWHYMFYVDVNVDGNSDDFHAALAELQDQECDVFVLGSYVSGDMPV